MRFPKWCVPIVLRILSLAGLTSAGGNKASVMVGLALSTPVVSPAKALSQPPVSLELDLFIQVADHGIKVPIMPLHLLGKKSWNVYNHDNIEKVRRDEAVAKAKEEAEEQRMQEIDAERRIQILRGETPTPLPIEDVPQTEDASKKRSSREEGGRERKKRKRYGENDTDFEMRVAQEHTSSERLNQQIVLRKDIEAPITDHAGHISLFPQDAPRKPAAEKNAEAEKELAKKKKEYEDQYTMRFSNAAGFKQSLQSPWYSKTGALKDPDAVEEMPGKDVWGNEDPRRKEREHRRVVENDPLAMMKQGAAGARQVQKERKLWRDEKDREMRQLDKEERRRKRHRRKYGHKDDDDDDLEDFTLDGEERKVPSSRRDGHDGARQHSNNRSSRSEHREEDRRDRHRHRHRHRD